MKQEKILKYQAAKRENSNNAWNDYKIIRNNYKVKIENEKNKYINNQINNAKDQKDMWREIKDLVLKKNKNVIQSVIFNNIEYKDNYNIASQFNNYFIQSIKEINDTIENVPYMNNIPLISTNLKFRAISLQELEIICKNLKNKSDFNRISKKILLDNWNVTGQYMLKIINESLNNGIFPENWKQTMVTPIEKIPKTNKCEEFRPINNLKLCEKILETVVKNN